MASGINSTFRQVGIATGIALLGALFSNKVREEVLGRTAAVPGLSHKGPQIATAVQSGEIGQLIGKLPARAMQTVAMITRAAFTMGLNGILLVAAIIALVSAAVSLTAIRSKDFAPQQRGRAKTIGPMTAITPTDYAVPLQDRSAVSILSSRCCHLAASLIPGEL